MPDNPYNVQLGNPYNVQLGQQDENQAPPEWINMGKDQQSWDRLPTVGKGIFRAKMTPQGQSGPRKPQGVSDTMWYGTDDAGRQQILNNVQSHGAENTGGTPAHDAEQPGLLNDLYSGVKSALHNTFGGGSQYSEEGGGLRETHPEPKPQQQSAPAKPDEPVGDSGEGQPQQKPSYAQQLGQFMQAHEVAGVDPERQAGLEQAYKDEIAARLAAGDISAHGQEVSAEGLENAARQHMADEQQHAENERARQDYLDRLSADVESDSKDLADSKIDPEHFWHSRSTPQQVAGIIGMALGGFLQGFKGGANPAANMIQSAIENDIHAQRENLENRWQGLRMKHSLLADKAERYKSLEIAERQQITARLQGAMLMAQAAAMRATSPLEKANAVALASQLEQKAVESGIAMNKWVSAGYVGGVPGQYTKDVKSQQLVNIDGQWVDAGDMETARDITKRNQAADHLIEVAEQMKTMSQQLSLAHPIDFYKHQGDIQALQKQMSQEDINDAAGGSRGGLGYLKYISDAYSGAGSTNPLARQKAQRALDQFIAKAKADKTARINSLSGQAVVQRIADPATQRATLRIIGNFDPGAAPDHGGRGPAVQGFKPAGQ